VSSPVRKYVERGFGWYVAFVDDETGVASVCSDFGDYAYRWSATGVDDLRRFLVSLDPGYLASKFGQGQRELQVERSVESLREAICYGRRHEGWKRDACRDLFDAVEHCHDEHELVEVVRGSSLPDIYEHIVYDRPQQLRAFIKEVWPRIVAKMRAELAHPAVTP
jgi:hypothetical protein